MAHFLRDHRWLASDEMKFIDALGSHQAVAQSNGGSQFSRLGLLNCYKRVAESRADWGEIDKGSIMAHLEQAIQEEGRFRR